LAVDQLAAFDELDFDEFDVDELDELPQAATASAAPTAPAANRTRLPRPARVTPPFNLKAPPRYCAVPRRAPLTLESGTTIPRRIA